MFGVGLGVLVLAALLTSFLVELCSSLLQRLARSLPPLHPLVLGVAHEMALALPLFAAFYLVALSTASQPHSLLHRLVEMLQQLQLLLLLVLLVALALLGVALRRRSRQWHEWELIPASEIRLSFEAHSSRKRPHWCFQDSERRVVRRAHYFHCLRASLLQQHHLPPDFAFADYASQCAGLTVRSTSRLGVYAWAPIAVFALVFGDAPTAAYWACVGLAWLLVATASLLRLRVRWIMRRLALHAEPRDAEFDLDDDQGADAPLLAESNQGTASFTAVFPLRWPQSIMVALHALFVSMVVCTASLLVLAVQPDTLLTPLSCTAIVLPLIVVAYLFPSLISNYVLVRFLGPCAQPDILTGVLTHVRT